MANVSTQTGIHALVFGASGISGWAILNNVALYPSPSTFARVIGLTNRPLSKAQALLPDSDKIQLVSGIDLMADVEKVKEGLKRIEGVDRVSHVYFTAYTAHGSSYQDLKSANCQLLSTAVTAVEAVCPNLAFWVLQTGGKAYGVEFWNKIELNPPFEESMPRIPQPYADDVFYYAQVDVLRKASYGKKWGYTEVRPDAIIGFVPNSNAMNLAQNLALFLSLYASLEGPGSLVPFPGSPASWRAPHNDTSQDILARFIIHASLHPDLTNDRAFNIADTSKPTTWEYVWPGICKYFGLVGVGPQEPGTKGDGEAPNLSTQTPTSTAERKAGETPTGEQYVMAHLGAWHSWVAEHNLKEGALEATTWGFMTAILSVPFARQIDLTRSREVGFSEEVDTIMGYYNAFARMRKGRIIP